MLVDLSHIHRPRGHGDAGGNRARLMLRPKILHLGLDDVVAAAAVGEDAKLVLHLFRPVHAHRHADGILRQVLDDGGREQRRVAEEAAEIPMIELADLPDAWRIEKVDDGFRILGKRIEGFATRTNFDNPDAVDRLRDIMRKVGIARELERQGLELESNIYIGEHVWYWFKRD